MNQDILKGKWNQVVGEIKAQWGDLTDDELTEIDGNRQKLMGKLQEKYGYTRDEAERQVDRFFNEPVR